MAREERKRSAGGNEVGRRIPFWIWCLASSGMTAGLLILALLTRHLLQLDAVNDSFGQQRNLLNDVTNDLRKPISQIESFYADVFQRDDPATLRDDFDGDQLKRSVEHLVDLQLPKTVEQMTFGLVGNIERGVKKVRECFDWRQQRAEFERRRFAALTRVQEFIENLRLQCEDLILVLTNDTAILRERINSDSVQKATQALREFTAEGNALKRKTQLTRLKQDLAKLTPLALALFLTEDLDKLGDFRDKFHLLLAAMQQSINAAELGDQARDLEATLGALRDALTGGDAQSGPQAPQNLFRVHQEWLQYARRGEQLKNAMDQWRKDVQRTMDRLDFELDSASFEAGSEMQERLWSLLTTCLVFGALAGGLFLLLARAISRAARAQIRELQQARRVARDAARAQSLFLANMSHEIRTPMNGVLGMAEMLSESPLDDQQRQYAATIKGSAEALLTVINDILDFTKIEAGKLQLNNLDFDLRATVEDTVELLAHMASAKGIELVSFIEHSVPRCVRGDPDRLRQVLLNLAGNAVKFTAEGEVCIVVEVTEQTAHGAVLLFSIRDTGIGIDAETQHKLFNPFTQADATTTRRFGGTGLGLAISRRLIEAMGGEISLYSHPGVGSTFNFSVPLSLSTTDVSESGPAQFGGRSALIVDDNETNREILGLRLADWKMGFELAADGDQALTLLREVRRRGYRFDIALVDLHMEPMDGLAFARQVRRDAELADLQIILLSSAGPKPPDLDLQAIGVHAWLTKPVRESRLRQTLRSALTVEPESSARPAGVPIEAGTGELGLHVLVAEDNSINQRVIREMLRKMGCTSEFADNGALAVERVQAGNFDLVLMDCQMPEMDGFTATRAIRAMDEPICRLPILALTANVLPDDREACRAAGMDAFLGKPIKKDQLYSALRTWSRPVAVAAAGSGGEANPD